MKKFIFSALLLCLQSLQVHSQTVLVGNCSGALVRFDTSKAADNAMVLTSGRCYEGDKILPNKFLQDVPSSRQMQLQNAAFESIAQLQATRLVYAATSVSNIALYEINLTHEEIKNRFNVEPYTLGRTEAVRELPIEIISSKKRRSLTCEVCTRPKLVVEGDWTYTDSIYYSTYPTPGCHTTPGMEGSPVVIQGTKEVVAVDSTRNMATDQRCREDNVCEVNEEEGYIVFGYQMSYGQPTNLFYACLDEFNRIDLMRKGCQLPPNRFADISPYSKN